MDFPLLQLGSDRLSVTNDNVQDLRALSMRTSADSLSFLVYTRDYEMLPLVMGRSNTIRNAISRVGSPAAVSVHCDGGVIHITSNGLGSHFLHGLNSLSWEPRQSVISRMMGARPRVRSEYF